MVNGAQQYSTYRAVTPQTAEPVEQVVEDMDVEEVQEEKDPLCAFLGGEGSNKNEDASIDSEEDMATNESGISNQSIMSNRHAWKRKSMYLVGFVGVFCVAATTLLATIDASDGEEGLNPHHGVFDAPQFEQLLWEYVQPVLGSKVAQTELSGHIKHSIRHLKAIAEKDLPKDQASALKKAQLTAQNWIDLKDMVHGARDPDVQEAGKITMNVLNHNLFSSESVIHQRLTEALQPQAYKLMELRSKIIPARIDLALGAWAMGQNESHGAWKGLLDSPMALGTLRNGQGQASVERRLGGHGRRRRKSSSPSPSPSGLGIGGQAVGILSVIMVAIGEILVHVEMFVPNFALPWWAWKLILTPVEVVSVLTCSNGANAYCNTIMGAMGLNTLDAVFVLFCKKNLFGKKAADYCKKELNPGSIDMQKNIADELSGALGGDAIFHGH